MLTVPDEQDSLDDPIVPTVARDDQDDDDDNAADQFGIERSDSATSGARKGKNKGKGKAKAKPARSSAAASSKRKGKGKAEVVDDWETDFADPASAQPDRRSSNIAVATGAVASTSRGGGSGSGSVASPSTAAAGASASSPRSMQQTLPSNVRHSVRNKGKAAPEYHRSDSDFDPDSDSVSDFDGT